MFETKRKEKEEMDTGEVILLKLIMKE